MAVYDLYSKRQKRLNGDVPDVYTYDDFSSKLRNQIWFIIAEALGMDSIDAYNKRDELINSIYRILCKEYGVEFLYPSGYNSNEDNQIKLFFLNTKSPENVLDIIELIFKIINSVVRESTYRNYVHTAIRPDEAIEDLNTRFKENGVGYYFEGEQILRIDSTYTHSEIAIPTLNLLSNPIFKNADEEYRKAHAHYKEGRNQECLIDCLKAFESTMKIIFHQKGWEYDPKAQAKGLINICLVNNLIPEYLQTHFSSLRGVLEAGIPTVRNKEAGHGQGVERNKATDELTRYALNLTGSNILLLIELSKL